MQLCNLNFFKTGYTFCPAKVFCKRTVLGYKLICDDEHVQEKKVHQVTSIAQFFIPRRTAWSINNHNI